MKAGYPALRNQVFKGEYEDMSMNDPVADLLTRVRNANERKNEKVDIPSSTMKEAILKVLKDEGFIANYKYISDHKQGILRIYMKYSPTGERIIRGIRRVSSPGKRCYKRAGKIDKIYRGLGISILSTSQGLMTDKKCRKMNIGGEIICNVW